MTGDILIGTIASMLEGAGDAVSLAFGKERVICGSGELRETLTRIEARFSKIAAGSNDSIRLALLSDDDDERRMIASAIVGLAAELGLQVKLSNDSWGTWARDARNARDNGRTIHVLTAVPPPAKAQQGFAAISGSLILLWPPQFASSALLPEQIEDVILAPFSERPLEKAAHVIDAIWTTLNGIEEGDERQSAIDLFARLDASALLGACIDITKLTTSILAREAGNRLANSLRVQSALRPGEALSAAEIYRALSPQPDRLAPHLRRLWVEGSTDAAIIRLAERLARADAPGLLDGIHIEPIGGVAQVEAALQRCNRDPNLELFMFDADADGRMGEAKVRDQGFPALVLDRSNAMGACDDEWVIEDLLSVSCLDRFYSAHRNLKPAREEIAHQPPEGRRLVLRGEDKGTLVEWLERETTLDDLYGVLQQIKTIRRRFALRDWPDSTARPVDASIGLRPRPWWFIGT